MPLGKCYIGTSGFSYPHWAKGRFYPKGLKQADWLHFFAQHFNTVEINASFYRLPTPQTVARWHSAAPPRFRFALKLWRRITHLKRLADCRQELADFLTAVSPLHRRRGPLLVQLPPSMHQDIPGLDQFLTDLKDLTRPSRWKIAVEFRNKDWLCDAVYRLLDRHPAALCLADMPACPITKPNNVPFVYIRRHGPTGRYQGCYTPNHIADDAARIQAWLRAGKDVFVYYNNDVAGHAVDNARQLLTAIAR